MRGLESGVQTFKTDKQNNQKWSFSFKANVYCPKPFIANFLSYEWENCRIIGGASYGHDIFANVV